LRHAVLLKNSFRQQKVGLSKTTKGTYEKERRDKGPQYFA